ncbi:MAG: carbohydrate binding family 9 domain-containing protein [Lewinellaceae bacterium]|nr:carbohydrate binding family 9 domain-containing protein [Lewinellaceae bacterium]
MRHPFFFLLPLLLSSRPASADGLEPIIPKKIEGTVHLDGLLDEPFWNAEARLPVTQHRPVVGAQPSEETEIMLVYNDQYLYLGGRLWDSEADKIQSPSKKRDDLGLNNDWLGIIIDSFHDKENALAFFTTPSGLRLDMSVFNDAVGEFPINESWNTFWDVAVKQTPEGWFVEMRIPFTSLRFQEEEDGAVRMGIISWRWIARKNELISFPAIPFNWGFWSAFKPSQAQELEFRGITTRSPVYLAPYALAGVQWQHELNEQETAYIWNFDRKVEPGLDLKYNLTSNLTLDLTANTDFAQVEVDDQQVNLDRFSLYFPEKRLFFQERSSVFDVGMGSESRLFYSRRIGLNEDGDPVRIYGGARLIGRLGNYDLGFIDMQTAAAYGMNSENMGVLRLRRRIINPYSYIGGILTNRTDFQGNFNTVAGLDGIFRVMTNDFLKVRYAQSFENGSRNRVFSPTQSRFQINWENVRVQGLSYNFSIGYHGVDYNPGLGFEGREDFVESWYDLKYGWNLKEEARLLRGQVSFLNNYYYNLLHQKRESTRNSLFSEFEYKSGHAFGGGLTFRQERVFEPFEIGDIEIPADDYRYLEAEIWGVTPNSGLWYLESFLSGGQFFGGKRFTCGLTPSWNVSSSLTLSGFYQFNYLDMGNSGTETVQIARIRALLMFNTRLSVSGFVQYNSAAHIWAGNFRLRYNPKEGNDLYIVFNEDLNSDREREIPMLPGSQGHTVVVKYTYTFVL